MRKSAVAIPLLALIAGAVGFLFRKMEVNTAFEKGTGLAVSNAPSATLLIGFTILVIALAAVLAFMIQARVRAEDDYTKAFAPSGFLYITVSFILGFVWLAAEVLYYFTKSGAAVSVVDLIFIFLGIVSAFAVIFLARGAYKGRGGTEMIVFSLIPPIFFCYWLIILYKDNAANPVLLSYCYQILAIAAAALSSYFSAGFVYRKAVTGKALFSFIMTIYLCTVVLADATNWPVRIIFAVTMILQFVNTVNFIRNLKEKN